jgi:hypothetical protein
MTRQPSLTALADEARHARQRVDLYRAKLYAVSGGDPRSKLLRLERLERRAQFAERRLGNARRAAAPH